ncbi:MAG: hypothetical protein J6I84_04200 [Bacilli bacterium]|nr:hypothetical protein [Bacilli bacterium]
MTKEEVIIELKKLRDSWVMEKEFPSSCEPLSCAIEILEKTVLPSSIEDVALNRVTENGRFNEITGFDKMRIEDIMFGAEWMASQGETIYDTINVDGKNQRWLGENLLQGDYEADESVIIQVRKYDTVQEK